MQSKKPFEIILHVGRVTSLQSWVAKKSCHGQTLINECSIFDYPSSYYQLLLPTVKLNGVSQPISIEYKRVHGLIQAVFTT